ncbi:unnamed protein product [Paramecium sonneborni]|uniref:Transmembrane protein n=1 Tax=Paramecium sonneborni TaxID=65129 RepID=A0A8S1QZG3_9CILI|nr:unnamed protein product [Paramecium sonneborni]
MQQNSFGYFNIDNSSNKDSWVSQTQYNNKSNKQIKRFMTDDFSHFEKVNFKQIQKQNSHEFQPQTIKEVINKAKLRFVQTSPNSITRRQEKQTVPFYIKERDDQVKKVKSFKSPIKEKQEKDEDYNQKVYIFLIEAFLIIFLILFATELFLRKYLQ